ncbi:MAG TPA: ABC transporter permease [Gemmatimonadaceae bacterium]|nr:ABC transporter permease [Gemmatimonadaceae bacterium]
MLRNLRRRLRALLRRGDVERELDEELRFHLELETEKNLRLGLDAAEARRRALVAFGGVERFKEEHRDGRGTRWLEDAVGDAHLAVRALRRRPALTAAAVLTLALGIGANTAIFGAVNAVILRPLPYPHPDRLVLLWEQNPDRDWYQQLAAPANFLDWREQVHAFQAVGAYTDWLEQVTLATDAGPRLAHASTVAGDFFAALGVRPLLGRTLGAADAWTAPPVAVVSHALWRDVLGADPAVVGRTVRLDDEPVQVVGVMPEGFAFPTAETGVWLSPGWTPAQAARTSFRRAHWLRVVARLRPGVSPTQADAELQTVAARLEARYPETNTHMGAGLTPLHDYLIGDTRLPLLVMLGAAGLLLLIACANVGNLLLVRALGREREVAVRVALGAGRLRLVRQALTESLVLAAIGGAAGLAVGWLGTRALLALQPAGLLPAAEVPMDWRVFAYVLAVTAASGALFGVAPAAWGARRAPSEAMRAGGRGASDGRRLRRWGDALVVVEVVLALMLTTGAGLLAHSLWRLRSVPPGFEARGVLAVGLELPGTRYDDPGKVTAFYDALLARARALPGVTGAAAVSVLPLTSVGWSSDFTAAGWPADRWAVEVVHRAATPDYFRVMRVPLLAGRAFTATDGPNAPMVVVVNEALARRYFPAGDAVGQRIAFDRAPDSTSVWRTIVGVVGSEHQATLAVEPSPEIFAPAAQDGGTAMEVVVRTTGEPLALAEPLRRAVAELDPALAVHALRPMTAVRAESMARERFLTTLLLTFALVGLVLAMVGVFGVMAQLVERRVREMGIRLALGAPARAVRWLVVRHGLVLLLAGLVIGAVGAAAAARAMRGLLYGVAPMDPLTFVVMPLVLAASGLAAAWVPARRASRADPAVVLRGEE